METNEPQVEVSLNIYKGRSLKTNRKDRKKNYRFTFKLRDSQLLKKKKKEKEKQSRNSVKIQPTVLLKAERN